jgi:hypothetical protein
VAYSCNVADLETTRKVFAEIEKDQGGIELVTFPGVGDSTRLGWECLLIRDVE